MKENNSKIKTINNTIKIVSFTSLILLILMFIVGITILPNYEETPKETFVFNSKMEKDYILEKIDEVIDSSYKVNVKKQNIHEYDDDVITYSTGNKVLDHLIQPITVHVDKDFVIVVASWHFIDKLQKVLR